ncbi:hypothetical protein TYRP_004600 [Tyrophagus putrescentiae]|nr:hypothetical protein TYRP_004600 [Tyrophagus putrescentiae]
MSGATPHHVSPPHVPPPHISLRRPDGLRVQSSQLLVSSRSRHSVAQRTGCQCAPIIAGSFAPPCQCRARALVFGLPNPAPIRPERLPPLLLLQFPYPSPYYD